ncbi:hypothetical protein ACI3PL_25265, partial [Lacticaseibacillus paracasei]
AGDPWGTALPGSYPAGSAGEILANANSNVTELWQLAGLDITGPMTVTPTFRTASGISLTISGDGTTITTVTRDP